MHIGLFGGSFNPPHLAHLIVAETVREACGLDQVLWMPNYQSPHKQGHQLASAAHRLAMTRLAVEEHPGFSVSALEVERGGVSYTYDTILALQATHPDASFSLLIGGDSLRTFDTWHRPEEIAARAPLIVYERAGDVPTDRSARFAAGARFVEAPLLGISGTDIRARRRAGRSIRYLVPEAVRAYIETHGLYL